MTRNPASSTSLAILIVFLKNGNQPLNVTRIAIKIKNLKLEKFTITKKNEANAVKPTVPSVSSACDKLFDKGYLDRIDARPPKSSSEKITPHYFLPVEDPWKTMEVTKFLLNRFGPQLVNSTYGQSSSMAVIQEHMNGILDSYGIKLTKDEREDLVRIISDSPDAMRRVLDLRLVSALKRLSGGKEDRQTIINALTSYLNAARTIDITEDKGKKKQTRDL